jgi:hypothetical protein
MPRTIESHGSAAVVFVLPFALPAAARLDIGAVNVISPTSRTSYSAVTLQVPAATWDARDRDRRPCLAVVAAFLITFDTVLRVFSAIVERRSLHGWSTAAEALRRAAGR